MSGRRTHSSARPPRAIVSPCNSSSSLFTDQPSQWKNVTLQGKDGRPDQCQVDANSVSVLVDHFSFFSLVGRSFPNGQQSRKRPAKRMLAAVFAVPPRLNSDWLLNIVLLDDTEAAFKVRSIFGLKLAGWGEGVGWVGCEGEPGEGDWVGGKGSGVGCQGGWVRCEGSGSGVKGFGWGVRGAGGV